MMSWNSKSSLVRRNKIVHCAECQSALIVSTNRESADHLHSLECPLRWTQNEGSLNQYQNDSEFISDSDLQDILQVVEIYPLQSRIWDYVTQAGDVSVTDEDESPTDVSDSASVSSNDMTRNTKIPRTALAENVEGNQQNVNGENSVSAGCDAAMLFTNENVERLSRNTMNYVSSDILIVQESLTSASVENDTVSSVCPHICQAPLFINSNTEGYKEQADSDKADLKSLHETLQHKEVQPHRENDSRSRSIDRMDRPADEENDQTMNGHGRRNTNQDDEEDGEGIKEEDKILFELSKDAENLLGKINVDPSQTVDVEKAIGTDKSTVTFVNDV